MYHTILKNRVNNWKEIEMQIECLPSTSEIGNVFEQFVYLYLILEKNLYQISEVYMYKDIPPKYKKKFNLEKKDCGVDGLIVLNNGKSAAYQAKFRTERKSPSYAELTKFWAEARLTDYNYTIANCYSLSNLCAKHVKHLSVLVNEFDALKPEFFEELWQITNNKPHHRKFHVPDGFQKRMIANVLKGFTRHDRGKLIAACGTGKTLTSLWISEAMKSNQVLFLAPSLALIKQTLEVWSEQSKEDFSYLCVCSDKTVSEEIDSGDIDLLDLNVPATTSPDIIFNYLSLKSPSKKIIFSTYQSLDVLSEGIRRLTNFSFDLIIFDEAHRTAGAKSSALFSLALYQQNIPSRKRLFMTATERLVRPWIIKKAEKFNRIVFSMDDTELYGPIFDRFNFGEAIHNKIISDYRIIVAGVKEKEIYDWIKDNRLLIQIDKKSDEYHTCAQNVFRQIMLVKAMQEFSIKKCITFHSTVKNAQVFIDGMGSEDLNFRQIVKRLWPNLSEDDLYLDHVNGKMNAGDRKERLDLFEVSNFGVVSNARCLTEGIDVPIIDSIYFVNPKNSLIDIIQACGRALRKPRDKHEKLAYFIIPILIPEEGGRADIINEIDFEMLYNLIQSLRDQDQRLAQWIDKINLIASKGEKHKFSGRSDSPIVFDLPTEFDVKDFEQKLYLRIAEVNKDPISYEYKTKKYGIAERKSYYGRIFKTLGDYSVKSYRDNLVMSTMRKFNAKELRLLLEDIQINHNNVSHTERLGLLLKKEGKYELSPLGIQLFEKKISFEALFKQQMLRYFTLVSDEKGERILFPYGACLKILLEVKSINFIEFVFGLYSLIDSSEEAIAESIKKIEYLRCNFPNLEILSDINKPRILKELNEFFGANFSTTDIWEKKTTINNQYIYFRNHLSLFNEFIVVDNRKRTIKLVDESKSKLEELLSQDSSLEQEKNSRVLNNKYIQGLVAFFLFAV